MDSKTLIKALKTAVREVIKEELTEILREGLQSTITEMKQSAATVRVQKNVSAAPAKKSKGPCSINASVSFKTDAHLFSEK